MFANAVLFAAAVFTALAAATPVPQGAGSCSTGPITCCEDLRTANDASVTTLLGLLGVVVQDVTAQIGIQCSPVDVVGVASGSACSANAVCCENNNFGGLVSIGCVPVTL